MPVASMNADVARCGFPLSSVPAIGLMRTRDCRLLVFKWWWNFQYPWHDHGPIHFAPLPLPCDACPFLAMLVPSVLLPKAM
eukprot:1877054-Karenia_brevis.AAC.1